METSSTHLEKEEEVQADRSARRNRVDESRVAQGRSWSPEEGLP